MDHLITSTSTDSIMTDLPDIQQQHPPSTDILSSPRSGSQLAQGSGVGDIIIHPTINNTRDEPSSTSLRVTGGEVGTAVKIGIGSANTSILDLFPVLGTFEGGRLKIDWANSKEPGLAIRPEESLFDLVQKSSRLTELVVGGKSIAAALGTLHSGARLLDSENAARRSMSPLESKMYEAWNNGAMLPPPKSFCPSSPSTATIHRQQSLYGLGPEQGQKLRALAQLYKLGENEGFGVGHLEAFEREYPQLQPLINARCKVLSMEDDGGLLRSDRIRAESLALRKTINMMDGALNDIISMIANAVQTVNETSELLRARLEGFNLPVGHEFQTGHQKISLACCRSDTICHQPSCSAAKESIEKSNIEGLNQGGLRDAQELHDNRDENADGDDAMGEDRAGEPQQQTEPSSSLLSSRGTATIHEAQVPIRGKGNDGSEASDRDQVEELLSDSPDAEFGTRRSTSPRESQSQKRSSLAGESPLPSPELLPSEAHFQVPEKEVSSAAGGEGGVRGFMSLHKQPTFLTLGQQSKDSVSMSVSKGPNDDSPDLEPQDVQLWVASELKDATSKSRLFGPAGSSGGGSAPFPIGGRQEE